MTTIYRFALDATPCPDELTKDTDRAKWFKAKAFHRCELTINHTGHHDSGELRWT